MGQLTEGVVHITGHGPGERVNAEVVKLCGGTFCLHPHLNGLRGGCGECGLQQVPIASLSKPLGCCGGCDRTHLETHECIRLGRPHIDYIVARTRCECKRKGTRIDCGLNPKRAGMGCRHPRSVYRNTASGRCCVLLSSTVGKFSVSGISRGGNHLRMVRCKLGCREVLIDVFRFNGMGIWIIQGYFTGLLPLAGRFSGYPIRKWREGRCRHQSVGCHRLFHISNENIIRLLSPDVSLNPAYATGSHSGYERLIRPGLS